ncbi:helix-turn-helix transcriptional regulator [Dasania sp. GY-MA-18]|uniref:helix-turn-helix transcriptional regulator n=1 Tax=Dasania sp. GY-MA-18 TaxID=2966584 RepID=UPI0035CD1255
MIEGGSPKLIANVIARSEGTVRNHLVSIYNKLNISSQAELFGLFLEAMSTLEAASKDDPLIQLEIKGGDDHC